MRTYLLSMLLMFFLCVPSAKGAELSDLPTIDRVQARGDWLRDDSAYRTRVGRDAGGRRLVLDNGLVRREFLMGPNVACVSYENLVNMKQILRAVEPEAEVVLDGQRYAIGGLLSQPHKAYLKPEWIDQLTNDPQAFQFVSFEVSQPTPRLKWPRVRYADPNAVWPPKGVAVRFDFRAPNEAALASGNSDTALRPVLLKHPLTEAIEGWKEDISSSHARCSINNEGRYGEIYTPRDSAVFLSRDLPKNVEVVELEVEPGTDRSSRWGPGMALAFPNKTLRLSISPSTRGKDAKDVCFVKIHDGDQERTALKFSRDHSVRLRFARRGPFWIALARVNAKRSKWVELAKVKISEKPQAVRIGKMGPSGKGGDTAKPGSLGYCRIRNFAAFGPIDPKKFAKTPLDSVTVSVHYELYDRVPVMMKWITIQNGSSEPIELDRFTSEIISAVERGEHTSMRTQIQPLTPPNDLHVETNYMFGSQQLEQASRDSVHWVPDPKYHTQHQWRPNIPCQLRVEPTRGPDVFIEPGKTFQSFYAFELLHDSTDRERRGLAHRRMVRTVAPWVTEVPLILHLVTSNEKTVRQAIDQAAECGFEMVNLSFGSGFSLEREDPAYVQKWKKVADYARSKGIGFGAYSLLASRGVGGGNDVVKPDDPKLPGPWFGRSPALASPWGQNYFRKLSHFFDKAGFLTFTHDGSYPGDYDAKARPPLQRGLEDSQWVQWQIITDFYAFLPIEKQQ